MPAGILTSADVPFFGKVEHNKISSDLISSRPTRFTLVQEQRQPAGEFRQYIQDAASDSSDFRTTEKSPSDSPTEGARPRQDSAGTTMPMHDAARAIRDRQTRNQRPRQLNLQVSDEGLPPRTRQGKYDHIKRYHST